MSFEQSDLGNTSRLYAQPAVRMNLWLLGDETKEFTKWSEHRRAQETTQEKSLSKHRGRELMASLWGRWSNTHPPAASCAASAAREQLRSSRLQRCTEQGIKLFKHQQPQWNKLYEQISLPVQDTGKITWEKKRQPYFKKTLMWWYYADT